MCSSPSASWRWWCECCSCISTRPHTPCNDGYEALALQSQDSNASIDRTGLCDDALSDNQSGLKLNMMSRTGTEKSGSAVKACGVSRNHGAVSCAVIPVLSVPLEEVGDECVICLELFCDENPAVPTLCSCGENKARFHLSCLLSWTEAHSDCPTCRGPLFYQERLD